MNVKQVIVIRKDLKMRRGKEIAQGSHASGMWLIKRIQENNDDIFLSEAEQQWMNGEYRKIVCQVDSEMELIRLSDAAERAGLESHMITDLGMTEFHGVSTVTALAIGPDFEDSIDRLTSNLKLY